MIKNPVARKSRLINNIKFKRKLLAKSARKELKPFTH